MVGGRIERIVKSVSSIIIYPCKLIAFVANLKKTALVLFADDNHPPCATYARMYIYVMYDVLN